MAWRLRGSGGGSRGSRAAATTAAATTTITNATAAALLPVAVAVAAPVAAAAAAAGGAARAFPLVRVSIFQLTDQRGLCGSGGLRTVPSLRHEKLEPDHPARRGVRIFSKRHGPPLSRAAKSHARTHTHTRAHNVRR